MDHPQAVETLAMERYLLREMNDTERDAFEDHYFSCVECAQDARAAAVMQEGVASGVARGADVASIGDRPKVAAFRPKTTSWRNSIALPWAAAALLAVGLGYQTFEGPFGAARSTTFTGAVALAPATLRPASRGEEAVVTPGPGGVLTLAVDLGGTSFGGVAYDLSSADGRVVASGTAPVPVGGSALLLMLPTQTVSNNSRYVLTLRDSTSQNLTPQTYRFTVKAP
ncbi:MAG TPA: zf-HC2 domain-containing protein [Vicinamibacterales bacterium]|jgi:hypothetical protein